MKYYLHLKISNIYHTDKLFKVCNICPKYKDNKDIIGMGTHGLIELSIISKKILIKLKH